MRETLVPYDTETTKNSIVSIYSTFINTRKESIITALNKLKTEETV